MRKTLILTLLLMLAAVGGFAQTKRKITKIKKNAPAKIKPAPAKETNDMNGEMTIALKQQAVDNASGIKIEFVEIVEDSRCPEGVNCFWAGSAKVKISVSKNGADGQTFELNTNLEPRSVVYQGCTITLTGVTPYPKKDVDTSKEDAKATFTVTKGSNSGSAI